ncbi:MAG TPA: ribosome silencing factor [Candidatus Acidoferrum sp.]|nr:ribosome silencing factor [Candidatus Acidoferrum sp.]
MKAKKLRDFVETAIDDMKGQNLAILDVQKLSSFADYMIVVTGTSNRHVRSIADEVEKRCKEKGVTIRGAEGQETAEWVLIDLGDVIVHVMQAATRKLYDLESLWKLSPAD